MKEIPILFSTSMVQAILAGRKTKTRRIAAIPVGDHHGTDIMEWHLSKRPFLNEGKWIYHVQYDVDNYQVFELKPKYGQLEDILWVREEHYRFGAWIEKEGVYTKGGRQKWQFIPHTDEILYEPPKEHRKGRHHKDSYTPAWHKRIARFMPKTAARIWLQVTDIRVERLLDIAEADAIAEGVEHWADGNYKAYGKHAGKYTHARDSFFSLWEHINGKENLEANPWVWVVCFKVLSTTGKPELIENLKV